MQHFIHSGDLGDVIYALPAVKAMGGGSLVLTDMPDIRTMHGMTQARFEAIRPLLAAQPYITAVYGPFSLMEWVEEDRVIDLNEFRRRPCNLHSEWLPNHYLDVLGIDRGATREPWLTLGTHQLREPRVVFARSARYHNPRFPWRGVIAKYPGAVFVGTALEHAAFNLQFDAAVPHYDTRDLRDAAKLISACTLFIGNQSCPLAIAEGLKKPIVCEVCPDCPNCLSPRPGFTAGWDENFRLPDLEEHAVQV